MTCGSDYHGKTKPAIELGETRCFIDEHDIEAQLKEYNLEYYSELVLGCTHFSFFKDILLKIGE